jgi:hypothetical protein
MQRALEKRIFNKDLKSKKKMFNNRTVHTDEHVGIGTRGLETKTTPMAKPF